MICRDISIKNALRARKGQDLSIFLNPYRFGGGGSVAGPTFQWSPTDKYSTMTVSGGGLIATSGASTGMIRGDTFKNTGIKQFELTVTNAGNCMIGITHPAAPVDAYMGQGNANGVGYYANSGQCYGEKNVASYGATFAAGDKIGCVVNFITKVITFYKNGVSQGSTPFKAPFQRLYPSFACYSSGGAIVAINSTILFPVAGATQWDNVSDPYVTSSCELLLNGEGTNGSTTFVDSSGTGKTRNTLVAPIAIDTGDFKYGAASISGTGGHFTYPTSSAWDVTDQDFTIESWFKGNATYSGARAYITGQADSSGGNGGAFNLGKNTSNTILGIFTDSSLAGVQIPGPTASTGVWHHAVFQRWGNTLMCGVDGVWGTLFELDNTKVGRTSAQNLAIGGAGDYFGGYGGSYGIQWPGWIDDCRIVKGRAIYPSRTSYTPPAAQLSNVY